MRKIHSGHPGLLAPLNDVLLIYVFKLCEQVMVVMMQMLSRRSSDLCQNFNDKLDGAKSLIVHKWLKEILDGYK